MADRATYLLLFLILTSPLWVLLPFAVYGLHKRRFTIRFLLLLTVVEAVAMASSTFLINTYINTMEEFGRVMELQDSLFMRPPAAAGFASSFYARTLMDSPTQTLGYDWAHAPAGLHLAARVQRGPGCDGIDILAMRAGRPDFHSWAGWSRHRRLTRECVALPFSWDHLGLCGSHGAYLVCRFFGTIAGSP